MCTLPVKICSLCLRGGFSAVRIGGGIDFDLYFEAGVSVLKVYMYCTFVTLLL